MNKGFTLAELLITVGIIGVISAVSIPAISSLRPDKTKIMYLKTYDTLVQAINSLASNSKLYPVCYDPENINANCSEYPLINTDIPIDNRFNGANFRGDKKLCNLIAESLGIDADETNCQTSTYSFVGATFNNQFKDNISFTSPNGFRWYIVPAVATSFDNSSLTGTFQTDVYVDIDPQNNDNNGTDESCIYNQDTCKNPDIFKFIIAANGHVTPADPKGKTYIETRKSFIKKDKEMEVHEIASAADNQTFFYQPCKTLSEEEKCLLEGKYWYDGTCNLCQVGQYPDENNICQDIPEKIYYKDKTEVAKYDNSFYMHRYEIIVYSKENLKKNYTVKFYKDSSWDECVIGPNVSQCTMKLRGGIGSWTCRYKGNKSTSPAANLIYEDSMGCGKVSGNPSFSEFYTDEYK